MKPALLWTMFALAGCSKSLDVAGSCDMRTPNLADSQLCIDVDDKHLDKVRALCARFTWSDKPCDRIVSLGGCRSAHSVRWEYASSKVQSAADVKKSCGDDTYLGPDGEPKD